jgi:hypothetical protein
MNSEIERLETLITMYAAQQQVMRDLLVAAVRALPTRVPVIAAFARQREAMQAMLLNSRMPSEDWIEAMQMAADDLLDDCSRPLTG